MKILDFCFAVTDVNEHWRVVPLDSAGTEGEGGKSVTSHGPETKHKSEVMLVQMRKKGKRVEKTSFHLFFIFVVQFQLVRDGQIKIDGTLYLPTSVVILIVCRCMYWLWQCQCCC